MEHGDWDRAISHAVEGGAVDRAGELLWTGIPEFTTRGRNATVIGWLDRLGEQTVATDAALSLTASYAAITQGAGGKTEHWAAVASGLIEREAASEKKTVLTAGLGLIEAALARGGVGAIADHTALAAELLPADSPWMSMCRLIEGVGLHLRGFRPEAHEKLADGARRGAVSAPNVQVLCLSQLALLAIEENDWTLAEMLASQARAQLDRSGIGDYPMMALALAVSAVVRSRTGRLEQSAADLRQGRKLLGQLEDFAPWYEAETWIALARAAARLDDAPAATLMLAEASRVLKLTPDAVVLETWIADTATSIETVSASGDPRPHPGRAAGPPVPADPPLFPADRRAGVRLAEHGEDAGAGRLPQARGQLEARGGRGGAGRRPARARRSVLGHSAPRRVGRVRIPDDRRAPKDSPLPTSRRPPRTARLRPRRGAPHAAGAPPAGAGVRRS